MFVVMTVLTVLKVPFEKAAPPCPSDVPAPLPSSVHEVQSIQSTHVEKAKLLDVQHPKVINSTF